MHVTQLGSHAEHALPLVYDPVGQASRHASFVGVRYLFVLQVWHFEVSPETHWAQFSTVQAAGAFLVHCFVTSLRV